MVVTDDKMTINAKTQNAQSILFAYLRAYWLVYAGAALCVVAASATQVQIPRILGLFTDSLQSGLLTARDPLRFAGKLALLAFGYVVLDWTAMFLVHRQARKFENHLRNLLFAHWERLSASYYTHHSIGDLMAHATNDVHTLRASISSGVYNLVSASFTTLLTVSMMVGSVDTKLAVYSLAPLPFLTVAVAMLRPRIRARSRAVQHGFSKLVERTQESISGIRVVKAYAREPYELIRFSQVTEDIVRRTLRLTQVSALFSPLIQLVGAVSFLIALGMGGLRVIAGDLSLGELVAFNAYLAMLIHPMQQVARVIDMSQRASSALDRLTELFAVEPEVQDSPHPAPVHKLTGHVVFSNLTFSYSNTDRPAISGLSLEVPPGATIGILGHTGSGKSTLANLLLRIYNPPPASIFIDGHDILDIPLAVLRRQIGYVPQDIFLFSTSIRENIAFALDDAPEEKVVAAAKLAQLYEGIMGFPEQFATEIGERGVALSGGQRQRLALARALIKEAPILILDDSLSAVDTETEAAILAGLRELRGQQTTFIIAHRISAVRDADLIIVLDDGRVVQQGDHEQLYAVDGPYRDIYELQRQGTGVGILPAAEGDNLWGAQS